MSTSWTLDILKCNESDFFKSNQIKLLNGNITSQLIVYPKGHDLCDDFLIYLQIVNNDNHNNYNLKYHIESNINNIEWNGNEILNQEIISIPLSPKLKLKSFNQAKDISFTWNISQINTIPIRYEYEYSDEEDEENIDQPSDTNLNDEMKSDHLYHTQSQYQDDRHQSTEKNSHPADPKYIKWIVHKQQMVHLISPSPSDQAMSDDFYLYGYTVNLIGFSNN